MIDHHEIIDIAIVLYANKDLILEAYIYGLPRIIEGKENLKRIHRLEKCGVISNLGLTPTFTSFLKQIIQEKNGHDLNYSDFFKIAKLSDQWVTEVSRSAFKQAAYSIR